MGIDMLDLNQVRSFIAVATDLHFGRAARRLNMTQPPLSRQIRLLEDYLGSQLFARENKSVSLTPAGINFLPEARALLARAEEAEAVVRRTDQIAEGQVRLGFYGAASFRLLPRIMARAAQLYPGIRILLREGSALQQLDAFSFGELDLGIVRPTKAPASLNVTVALQERLLLALPRGDLLTRRKQVRLSDLNGRRFIAYDLNAPYLHGLQQTLFGGHGVRPDVVHALGNAPAILSLVGVGLGAAIVPEHARFGGTADVVFRPIANLVGERAQTHLLERSGTRNPAVAMIHDVVLEVGRTLETEAAAQG